MFERRSELEKILAVAEAGKIVAAADRLAMTQPALTRAIARLESRFGASLFERLPTGVRPTPLGAAVAEQARRLLRAFEEAEDRIGGVLAGRSGRVRATADALWMQAVMPAAVGRFREDFPEVELRLRSAGRAEGLRLLESGDSDLHCGGIDTSGRLPDHLRREPLPALTMGVVADRHHPLQAGGVTVAALADWPWIDWIADLEPFGGTGGGVPVAERPARSPACPHRAARRLRPPGRCGRSRPDGDGSVSRLAAAGDAGPAARPAVSALPVAFGRRRCPTGLVLRRSAESLAPVCALRDMLGDTARQGRG